MLKTSALCLTTLISTLACAHDAYRPLPVPSNIRITSSAPRQIVWDTLSAKEKQLATHLLAAASAAKGILLHQNHRHGLLIKNMLEASLNAQNLASTKALLGEGFSEYLNYAIKFEDLVGPYATSNRKFVLSKVSAQQATELFKRYAPRAPKLAVSESVKLLTDPTYEVIQKPESTEADELEISGNNVYEHGITSKEVAAAFAAGLKSDLNCRIVRGGPLGLKCQVQALNNPELPAEVRRAMTNSVAHLKRALPFATTQHQANQLKYLIRYLELGNIEDFRQMNIEWVKDGTSSKVDFMMGYVEFQTDYMTQIASWESYVQIVDPKTTALSVGLAKHAQAFEDQMPYGIYKKTFPADYSPPAMMVYYFQELSSFRSGGYNLPNYDDIRRDVGAKNIIRLNLPGQDGDPTTLHDRREMYQEFSPAGAIDDIVNLWTKGRQTLVLLHEIIGHGSGTYNTARYAQNEDPTTALGSLGSSMEEQRADLAALSFGGNPIMVEVGMFADQAEATRTRNAMYDTYLANFLRDVSKQQSLSEAHQRGHWLLVNVLLEKGAITLVSRDGTLMTEANAVYKVNDYDLFHEVCVQLLGELQLIKAEREEQQLKDLYLKYAPLAAIQDSFWQTVIKRGAGLSINAGTFEQPWVIEAGKVKVFGELSAEGIAPYLKY